MQVKSLTGPYKIKNGGIWDEAWCLSGICY